MNAYSQHLTNLIDLLRDALLIYVLAMFGNRYNEKAIREINRILTNGPHQSTLVDLNEANAKLDAHALLKLMMSQWKPLFEAHLSPRERSFVSELMEARNLWAHQALATRDEVIRIADTMKRLMQAIEAPDYAEAAEMIYMELLREQFKDKTIVPPEWPDGRIPSWRTIIRPRESILDGRLAASGFAVDLESVVRGYAPADDSAPLRFFAETVLTSGLAALLANVLCRLNGIDAQPIIQLQTGYGGGKTHALLAAYHLASGTVSLAHIPNSGEIRRYAASAPSRAFARRAAVTGTAFDAANIRHYPHASTATIWGEIAYQLGGAQAYAAVAQADQLGIAPGAEAWRALFETLGPCLIILDELTAFARNLLNARTGELPAGTFASLLTGLQALTEAVSHTPYVQLLVTLPPPGAETGGAAGHRAYTALTDILGRVDRIWQPIQPAEAGLIARRRLFTAEYTHNRDAVVEAYHAFILQHPHRFPRHAATTDYLLRIYDVYPLHPELVDRLYTAWGGLDRFQHTRGVLRILTLIVEALWAHHDPTPMILTASVPLYESRVRSELISKLALAGRWDELLRREIDSAEAAALRLDRADRLLGRTITHRRLARSLFFGTAPLTDINRPRGLTIQDLLLGAAHPTDTLAHLDRGIERLLHHLSHLKSDDTHYWLSLGR